MHLEIQRLLSTKGTKEEGNSKRWIFYKKGN